MATVVIPALLRKLTGGLDRIESAGRTVGQLIDNLDRRFPGIREALVEDGELRPAIAVSVDGELSASGLREQVADESSVYFLPAIGGG